MQAIELIKSPETREPAQQETKQIVRHCYEHGLIVLSAGSYSNVIRVLVPLVITPAQWDEGLDVLESALQAVHEKKGSRSLNRYEVGLLRPRNKKSDMTSFRRLDDPNFS